MFGDGSEELECERLFMKERVHQKTIDVMCDTLGSLAGTPDGILGSARLICAIVWARGDHARPDSLKTSQTSPLRE